MFDRDLNGANGVPTLQVEAVSAGGGIHHTAGTLNSATARYSLRGETQEFASALA